MTGEPTRAVDPVEALHTALHAEYAAVYGYGFVGAHAREEARSRAAADLDAHRDQRDVLRGLLLEYGTDPAPPEDSYELPEETGSADVAGFAADLEGRVCRAHTQMAAASDPRLRDVAARWMQAATVRGLLWGAEPAAFPGRE